RPPEPGQHGLFRHAAYKADACQIHSDQEHLAGHPNLFFRGPQLKKDGCTGLGTVRLTRAAAKEASLAALGEICRDSTHVPTLPSALMRTRGLGARLAPSLGCSHRPILR